MVRTINRRYCMTADEVRDAVLDKLHDGDIPVPKRYEDAKFSMTDQGVMIEWTDDI